MKTSNLVRRLKVVYSAGLLGYVRIRVAVPRIMRRSVAAHRVELPTNSPEAVNMVANLLIESSQALHRLALRTDDQGASKVRSAILELADRSASLLDQVWRFDSMDPAAADGLLLSLMGEVTSHLQDSSRTVGDGAHGDQILETSAQRMTNGVERLRSTIATAGRQTVTA